MNAMNLFFASVPGIALALFFILECPRPAKRILFIIPTWISSTIIAFVVGGVAQGVTGSMTPFITDLILIPVFAFEHYRLQEYDKRKLLEAIKKAQEIKN